METNKILSSDVLDIIFDGKNKMYGAYDLRKTYNARLTKALIFTAAFVLIACIGTVFAKKMDNVFFVEVPDIEIKTVAKNEVPLPPPPPPPVEPVKDFKQIKSTVPIIVNNPDQADEIMEIEDDMVIGSKTVISENVLNIVQPPVVEPASSVIETPKANAEDSIYITVQNEAEFPGGRAAWARYLQKNLNAGTAIDNGAVPGSYQVVIMFIVSKDGAISDVHAASKHGYGMEEEAVKIIKRGPKWTPALQNGRNVNAYRRQPITFVVE